MCPRSIPTRLRLRPRRELYAPVLISKPSAHLQKPSLQDIASAHDALGGDLQGFASAQLAMRWGGYLQDIASAQLAMRWGGYLQDIASAQLAMRWGAICGSSRAPSSRCAGGV